MKNIIIISFLLLAQQSLTAQGQFTGEFILPEIALIRIEPDNSDVTLSLDLPGEAGTMNISKVLPTAKRIIYTSALPYLILEK